MRKLRGSKGLGVLLAVVMLVLCVRPITAGPVLVSGTLIDAGPDEGFAVPIPAAPVWATEAVAGIVSGEGFTEPAELFAEDDWDSGGYGSNGKFLAPIEPPAARSVAIATRVELEAIADNENGRYHLTADIDLSGEEWVPIDWFSGVFDGHECVK